MTTLYLREKDRTRIIALLAQHLPEASAWAYGSRVNGTAHEASDLDVVLRSTDLSPIPKQKLEALTQALQESNIPIIVEARDWARLTAAFHQEILKNYVVLKEAEPSTTEDLANKDKVEKPVGWTEA